MSNLLNSLKNLSNKLFNLESSVTKSTIEEEKEKKRGENKELLKETLTKLKKIQQEIVKINVGGRIYTFSLDTFKNTASENIFASSKPLSTVFYDGSPDLFYYVAELIREFQKEKVSEKNFEYKIVIRRNEDMTILKEMIKEVFPKAEEEVLNKIKIEYVAIKERVVVENNVDGNENANVNNNNYQDAAYNNQYNY